MATKKPSKMERNRAKIPQKGTFEAFAVGTSCVRADTDMGGKKP